ncbi:hypothetical protein FOC1_g10001304 [Fusarium oxysporum f. sp. cubense race 1]|uniref:Uncharacterized protein n=1 Tax=Fusarium oxysporum f. sp. cubense (strain race 1) TaxID=1229664 RepID=N4U0T3_FUSC1|nr:hypothetical protein FOC1_g10001304 [Fusarium oxysporum f. sp. cubense race 1]
MPDINIHNSTPAFIGWQSNDALHSLTEPDRKYNNITLTTRFDTARPYFELSVLIRLKEIRLRYGPQEAIRKKSTCLILRLQLGLSRNLDVIVPQHDFVSLYGGQGVKVVRLSAQTGRLPPLYSESTSPPPSAVAYQQKRSRQDSHDDCDNAMLQIWAVLTTMEGRDAGMEALENRIDVRKKAWKSFKSALHF